MAGKYDVRRDRVVFLDVEMTCWEGAPPHGEAREIIEFGLAELDVPSLEVVRSASFLVRPARSTVSAYCESLTGISAERLRREGRPLAEACNRMRKEWGVGSKAWMAWGHDRRAVEADCAAAGIASPFSAAFHDVGFQFGAVVGEGRGVGLDEAMDLLGVEREGRAHSGESDAVAAAEAWAAALRTLRDSISPARTRDPAP